MFQMNSQMINQIWNIPVLKVLRRVAFPRFVVSAG